MSDEKKSEAKDPFAVLNELREIERQDTRPRLRPCPIEIGGERLRLRRLHFPQLLAMKERLRGVGYKPGHRVTPKQLGELLHLVQISLVPLDDSGLRFCGTNGRSQLALLLEPEHIESLGGALVEWNEMFPAEADSPAASP